MHSKIAVFMPKASTSSKFKFSEIDEEDVFDWLESPFGADYCTRLDVSRKKFKELGWFDDYKVGDNEYIFSVETLRKCRLSTLEFLSKELETTKQKFDSLKLYEWSLFMYRMKNPDWLNNLEAIFLNENGCIEQVARLNELDELPCSYNYVGMFDYHF